MFYKCMSTLKKTIHQVRKGRYYTLVLAGSDFKVPPLLNRPCCSLLDMSRSCGSRNKYEGQLPEIKEQIIDMAVNGSGIRDTVWVLGISTDTVLNDHLSDTVLAHVFGCRCHSLPQRW
jgi:transposase-like protein